MLNVRDPQEGAAPVGSLNRSPGPRAGVEEDADVAALLRLGIRNRWYAMCSSDTVADEPVHLRRLGEDLVAWRDTSGTVHVQEDRCPHRGAPMSLGRLQGDVLACRYHGVEVDGAGTVVRVPGSPGCALEGRTCVRTYPTVERFGAVFAYVGDELNPEPIPFGAPDELTSDGYSHFLCAVEWHAPMRFVVENVLDPMHGAYLHRQSHSMSEGSAEADFRVQTTDKGFIVEKTGQRDVNFDWAELVDDGALWLRLEIPYPATGGPGGNFAIASTATAIDEERTALFVWRARQVDGWSRAVWRFLYRNRLEGRHWAVLEQDREMLEAMALDADAREHLYRHDLGVSRIRKYMRREARAQVEALRSR